MADSCQNCLCWRPIKEEQDKLGECWSGDRLDGDMSKGPAGYSYYNQVCEAFAPKSIKSMGYGGSVKPLEG